MGLRYRKSINLGCGFRINLSKSGVGYSWGFPGYRMTKKANGGIRTTYSLPGMGISYVEENKGRSYNSSPNLLTGETINYENTNIINLGKDDLILKNIRKLREINLMSNICIISFILFPIFPPMLLFLIIGIILKLLLATKWKIDLIYEFDDHSLKKYECLKNVMSTLSTSKKIWQVKTSTKVYNTKYNAGAGNNITRYNISLDKKLPFYIKHNVDIYSLKLKGEKMIFTPDRVLYLKGLTGVYGRNFRDMFIDVCDTRFVESDAVPKDAEIIDYTWQYVNRSGGPDKRFNNNKRLPICKYGQVIFKTDDGINIRIEYSNAGLKSIIKNSFIEFAKYHNEEIDNEQKNNLKSDYEDSKIQGSDSSNLESIDDNSVESEPLYKEVVEFVISNGKVSASLLQRKFKFGYNRAVRCVKLLEQNGIIGPNNGTKTRMVIIKNRSDEE